MNLPGLALRNLLRRPARSVLAAAGITMAIGSFVALTGLSRSMERSFVDTFVQRQSHVIAVRRGTVEIMTATLDERLAEELARTRGVASVAGELYDLVQTEDGDNVLLAGWPAASYLWGTVGLREGRLPLATEDDGVLMGDVAAEALGATSGKPVTLGGHAFVVTGVFSGGGAMSGKMAAVPLPTLQRLLGREGKVTVFNLRVAQPGDSTEVAETRRRLTEAFPGLRFSLTGEIANDNGPLRLLHAAAWATSSVALLIALFVVVNTLLVSVTERRREVGVLGAVGWSASRIMALVFVEGIVLAGLGGLLGVLLGAFSLHWLAETPTLRGFVKPESGLREVASTLFAILALGCLGSAYPAWRSTRVPAVDALKQR